MTMIKKSLISDFEIVEIYQKIDREIYKQGPTRVTETLNTDKTRTPKPNWNII